MCDCMSDDPYECWAERYGLSMDATKTLMAEVIAAGGPCRCWCHNEDEWANEDLSADATDY